MKTPNYFYYTAYGLSIASEIEFPEFFILEFNNLQIDIHIKIGICPEKLSIIGFQKPITAYNEKEYWQEVPNIAKYYAKNGSEIIIEPISENWQEVRLFFISNVLFAVLFQRNSLPLLGSGIVNNSGELVLFLAPFLSGKTTLLCHFIKKGYQPFCDNSFIVVYENSVINASPSVPFLVYWKDNLVTLFENSELEHFELRKGLNKIGLFFEERSAKISKRINSIVILDESKSISEISFEKLNAKEAFLKLHECHPRPHWIEEMSKNIQNFKLLSQLSNKIPTYLAKRPRQKETEIEFLKMIENGLFL